MFVRLKNVLDYDVMKNDLSKDINCTKVMDRLREALQVLDDSYGADRSSRDMGGYVFLFTDNDTYERNIKSMLENHHTTIDMYEYSDTICNEAGQKWQEELYLISSDDAILVIHP